MHVLNDWLLTPARAAIHLPTATAVVADLHLGYAEARCRAGEAVPTVSLANQLSALTHVFSLHSVRRLVVAGDWFEAGFRATVAAEFASWLSQHDLELVAVIPGNHDRGLKGNGRLPIYGKGFRLDEWQIVHGDGEMPVGRFVQGHVHPCLRWGLGLSAPCYLVGEDRLILPAFTAEAAGVNVLGKREWAAFRCCAIAGDKVLDFGEVRNLGRKLQGIR
jgi:metallophosphoesterase superfamily enzyme